MRKPYWSLIVAPTLATLALSAPVLAQDQETAEAGALEEVIITGSRIRRVGKAFPSLGSERTAFPRPACGRLSPFTFFF